MVGLARYDKKIPLSGSLSLHRNTHHEGPVQQAGKKPSPPSSVGLQDTCAGACKDQTKFPTDCLAIIFAVSILAPIQLSQELSILISNLIESLA